MKFIRKIVQSNSKEDAELYNDLKKLLDFSPKKN
jgi:ribonuclease-3